MEKKKFRIVLSDPVVVSTGEITPHSENVKWGPRQFPVLLRTVKGDIYCKWNMCNDDIQGSSPIGGANSAISEDNGKTWRATTSEDKPIGFHPMSNGKRFSGFVAKPGYPETGITDDVTPVAVSQRNKVYRAIDCPKADLTVYASETDPVSGEKETFEVKLNWPFHPIDVYTSRTGPHLIHPTTRAFSMGNQIVIGDELYCCMYERGFNSVTGEALKYGTCTNVYVFRSTDNARSWDFISQVLMDDEFYNVRNIPGFEGFVEPMMEVMPDGSVVMLIRTGGIHPSYITRSTDCCKTWSKPVIFDDFGVRPQIMTLKCGVTLASYGRPRMHLRATGDPSGLAWEAPIEIPMTLPFEEDPSVHHTRTSCFYTRLLPLDDTSALMVYTDFHYPDENGDPRKSVLVRTIRVVLEN